MPLPGGEGAAALGASDGAASGASPGTSAASAGAPMATKQPASRIARDHGCLRESLRMYVILGMGAPHRNKRRRAPLGRREHYQRSNLIATSQGMWRSKSRRARAASQAGPPDHERLAISAG